MRSTVRAITIAFITFICTFGSALALAFIRSWLSPTHLSKESQDVVRLGIGLVATMTALLLGLVTAAARTTFDTQDAGLRNNAATILTLDRHLARYGPETKPNPRSDSSRGRISPPDDVGDGRR